MAKTPSAKRSAGALATLNRIARQSTRTAVAKATGVPRSTLYTWQKKGAVPERSRARVIKAAKVAKEELTFSKAEVAQIKKEIGDVYRLRQQEFVAKASGHTVGIIQGWVDALNASPTSRNVRRIKDILEDARRSAKLIDESDIGATNPKTGERVVTSTTERYEGIVPPKEADRYRILGVNRDGDVIASTTYVGPDKWDKAVEFFSDVADKEEYNAQVVGAQIVLIYDLEEFS